MILYAIIGTTGFESAEASIDNRDVMPIHRENSTLTVGNQMEIVG